MLKVEEIQQRNGAETEPTTKGIARFVILLFHINSLISSKTKDVPGTNALLYRKSL